MATREFTVALSGKVESGNGIGIQKREGPLWRGVGHVTFKEPVVQIVH